MTYTLESDSLQIQINHRGMEISSIKNKENEFEYLWQGDPAVWAGQAPILFPIVGALKDGKTSHLGKEYHLDKHGFIRNNEKAKVVKQDKNSIVFQLKSDNETLAVYPFEFIFEVSFELKHKCLKVSHSVTNSGSEDMYYSIGAHPAFICPIEGETTLSEYSLGFPEVENDCTYHILPGGLIGDKSDKVLDNSSTIQLHEHIFDGDALIFKHLKSRSITLNHKDRGPLVAMEFNDFDYLGIWAKPGAAFVCIEPWLGVGDAADHSGILSEKDGIRKLSPNQTEVKCYTIDVLE
ncbi:aldose 1-epimerase family protein [Algoriphagus sp. PAP.12]|uniref:aldose 1-epimerase family protein n=1 Tax=Algoriphagus sp. PAP.12 TaxID=2996678 RepID=UPI00227C1871|nr:aldose 1-epimerase family protein [Algoriphagus sp. PAP.12]